MTNREENYEELDQYDYSDGEYLEKVADKYTEPIGLFLLNFSLLEQELNIAVADFISDRAHELGFVVIEKLTTANKIELFYKMYVRLESFKNKKNKEVLNKIRNQLQELNCYFLERYIHRPTAILDKSILAISPPESYFRFPRAV